jgi:hypothetical protein
MEMDMNIGNEIMTLECMITIQRWRSEDSMNRYKVDILAIQEIRGRGME